MHKAIYHALTNDSEGSTYDDGDAKISQNTRKAKNIFAEYCVDNTL